MFAIVAIPNQDDYVWNISSEKIPHMTLVAFEDPGWTPEELALVTGYVEHTASLMTRFGMDVDRRGELGDKKADVLFFNGRWDFGKVKQLRSNLMANTLINAAVRSNEQFPDWIPHLTLGFPATPAKKDTRDYPGTNWVNFDQLALWTGDFSGPTFRLTSDDSMEAPVSWSQAGSTEAHEILEHFGVKGMKWGVRKGAGSTSPASEDHARAAAARSKAKTGGGTKALTNNELQDLVSRMQLEQQFSRLQPASRRRKAAKFAAEIMIDVGKQNAKKIANDAISKKVAAAMGGK